jgi:hypothetical protein
MTELVQEWTRQAEQGRSELVKASRLAQAASEAVELVNQWAEQAEDELNLETETVVECHS